jgi:hypothetical protein
MSEMQTTLAIAIARSAGNKAITSKGTLPPIIVQQRYNQLSEWWYHIWWTGKDGTDNQLDLHMKNINELKRSFEADPNEKIWRSL